MKIYKGDLFVSQKKYNLAEKAYLSCDFTNEGVNKQKHKEIWLVILYKLMMVGGLLNEEKLSECNLKLQKSINDFVTEPAYDKKCDIKNHR